MKTICPSCGFEDSGNFCSNCGAVLPASDATAVLSPQNVASIVVRVLGIREVLGVLRSVHRPVAEINTVIAERPLPVVRTLIAFGELVLLFPLILKFGLLYLASAVNYPLVLHGEGTQGVWPYVSSMIGFLLITSVVWILPASLFRPNPKLVVYVGFLHVCMYSAIYTTLADILKVLLYSLDAPIIMVGIFGLIVYIAVLWFTIRVMRHDLRLARSTVALLLLTGAVVGAVYGVLGVVTGFIELGPLPG